MDVDIDVSPSLSPWLGLEGRQRHERPAAQVQQGKHEGHPKRHAWRDIDGSYSLFYALFERHHRCVGVRDDETMT